MTNWFDKKYSNIPEICQQAEDQWLEFDLDIDSVTETEVRIQTKKHGEIDVGCFIVRMKNCEWKKDNKIVSNEIPFYAQQALADVVKESGKEKGWIALKYQRTVMQDGSNSLVFEEQ